MGRLVLFLKKFRLLVTRKRFRSELDEEMAFHREQAEREFIAEGMSAEAARYAAMRQFGNSTRVKEKSHEVVGFRFELVWQDCRYAVRQMFRSPGFTAAVIGTLTLGIGATTAIFTLVYSTLLRSLPYSEADRIVRIHDVRLEGESTGGLVGASRFYDLASRNNSFESLGFFYFDDTTLIAGAQLPVSIRGAGTNAGFWNVYSVQPLLGRIYNERDDRPHAPAVAVLSYATWQQTFAGDPGVIGRQVTIEQRSTTIIGVMPKSFNVPNGIDLWRPAQFDASQWTTYRGDGSRFLNVVGRMRPGTSIASAQTDLQRIGEQLRSEHAGTDGVWQFQTISLREDLFGELRPALVILLTAAAFLLLIACFNVANLLLTRAATRQREVALRRALGASEGRIQLQFLTESTVTALAGGFAGLAFTFVLVRGVATKLPGRLGVPGTIVMNWPVVWFAFSLAVTAGLFFGLAPALQNRRAALNASLKQGERHLAGASGGRVRNAFIAVQVGLSLVLLVGASLLSESLWNLIKSPLGFIPDHVLTFRIVLPWNAAAATIRNFYGDVQRRIEALPGVTAAGQISALPTEDWHRRITYDADWMPRTAHRDAVNVEGRSISGDYLQAIGTQLLAGRTLTRADATAKVPPVLVNRAFVDLYARGLNVIGKQIVNDYGPMEIVGVVADVRGTTGSIAVAAGPEMYFSADGQYPDMRRSFIVRSVVPPEQLIQAIREQVHQVDPQQAIANVATMDDRLNLAVAQPRLNMALMAAFALIALLLACVGIYGVVAWSVVQRIQEIGVRMALGATRSQILLLFVRRAALATMIGLVAGTGMALMLTRLLRSQLYGVSPDNPWIYAASVLVLLFPVLFATVRPALHAASVNPVDALRSE
ncbi:MAG: ADOP family duplicated permease [Terracidiphilus sp.]